MAAFILEEMCRARGISVYTTTCVEVEGEVKFDARGRLEGEHPHSSKAVKIGARGMTGGSSVVEEEEAWTLPLAFLPAIVKVGVATGGRESGGE